MSGPDRSDGNEPDSDLPLGVHRVFPDASSAVRVDFRAELLARAAALGLQRIAITSVDEFHDATPRLRAWIEAGYHGEMAYLERERSRPRELLPEARSLIVVAAAYPGPERGGEAIASYARGKDYHRVLKSQLLALAGHIATALERPLLARPCVDTAPLLERAAAERAQLGITGKSTLTIVPGVGTYVLLGELLLDVALPELEPPRRQSACGTCTRCLDACPTGAFVAPYVLDARRCISYLTIEQRGVIPKTLREGIGTHVAGCDICQLVCPFNASKKARPYHPEFTPNSEQPDLVSLLELSSGSYRRLVKDSALSRLSRPQLQRNAAVALGNSDHPDAVPALSRALGNPHGLVRGHVAWALGRHATPEAREALSAAAAVELDPDVLMEIRDALKASLENSTSTDS